MKETKDFRFDKMALSYDGGFAGKLSKKFYKLLLNQIELHQGAAVLDVGCGTGTILRNLGKIADIDGYGIDIEENMIAEAKKKCPGMNICVSDCTDTPFDDKKFDATTACMSFHHFGDKNGFAKEAARTLTLPTAKSGGFLLHRPPLANPSLTRTHSGVHSRVPHGIGTTAFAVIPIHSALTRCGVFANPLSGCFWRR